MASNLEVRTTTIIAKGAAAPSRVVSPSQLRTAKLPFSESLARDIESLSQSVNTLHTQLASNAPAVSDILVKNPQSGVSSSLGNVIATLLAALSGKQDALTRGNLTETGSAVLVLTGNIGAVIGSGTTIQVQQASAAQSGYLSSADWSTFNGKQNALAFGNLTEATSAVLTITGGTGAVIGAGASIQVKQASAAQGGYLSSADWSTFNSKQAALTFGNLTEAISGVLTITGGTGAVIGSGASIQVKQASSTQSGYLSSTDWTTFNNKQAALALPLSIANGGTGQTTAAAALTALGGASLSANNTFSGTQTFNASVTSNSAFSAFFINRPSSFASNAVLWNLSVQHAGGGDNLSLGETGSTYTTGGAIAWLANSISYLYYPNADFRIGTGIGAIPVITFKGNRNVIIGSATDNGNLFQVAGTMSVSGALQLSSPLAITSGGTGATTAGGALTNLGAANLNQANVFTGSNTFTNTAAFTGSIQASGAIVLSAPSSIVMGAQTQTFTSGNSSQWRIYAQDGANAAADNLVIQANISGTWTNVFALASGSNAQPGLLNTPAFGSRLNGSIVFTAPASLAFGSDFIGYTPVVTGAGGMTISSVVVNEALYCRVGPFVIVTVVLSGVFGGTASGQFTVSAPIAKTGSQVTPISALVFQGNWLPISGYVLGSGFGVNVNNGGVFTLGSFNVYLSGVYKVA